MQISKQGLKFITDNESFDPKTFKNGVFYARLDPVAKVWDCAWGLRYDENGEEVNSTTKWSYERALSIFHLYVEGVEEVINRLCKDDQVQLTQNEFDALADFSYNIGEHRLKSSETWRNIKNGQKKVGCKCLMNWRKSGGKVCNGLINRRCKEMMLFNEGIYTQDLTLCNKYKNWRV